MPTGKGRNIPTVECQSARSSVQGPRQEVVLHRERPISERGDGTPHLRHAAGGAFCLAAIGCLTCDGLGNSRHWSAVGRRGVALQQEGTRLPLLRTRFCFRRAVGWTSQAQRSPASSGAHAVHVGSTPLRRCCSSYTDKQSARMGVGRAPPGSVAQVERSPLTLQSAASPHELPLPDEGRTVWAHDVEVRVQVPPSRAFHSLFSPAWQV